MVQVVSLFFIYMHPQVLLIVGKATEIPNCVFLSKALQEWLCSYEQGIIPGVHVCMLFFQT